jgi:hypothetical protein
MRALGTTIAEAIGPSLAALGITKKDRVDPRAGVPVRNEVVAWAGALGITEIEVYVGGRNPRGVYGVATETPSLVVGPGITAPLSPVARQAVARELFALTRGTTLLGTANPRRGPRRRRLQARRRRDRRDTVRHTRQFGVNSEARCRAE